jgi:hypothetical protein
MSSVEAVSDVLAEPSPDVYDGTSMSLSMLSAEDWAYVDEEGVGLLGYVYLTR